MNQFDGQGFERGVPARQRRELGRARLRVGAVFGRGLSIFLTNYVPFTVMAALVFVPWYVAKALVWPTDLQGWTQLVALGLAEGAISNILSAALAAGVVYGTIEELRGRRADLGTCVSKGLSRLLPVLGVAIVAGALTSFGGVVVALVTSVAMTADGPGFNALMFFGLAAALWFSFYVALRLWIVLPVAVLEGTGVGASLRRSWALTGGNLLRVLLLSIMTWMIAFGLGLLLALPLDPVSVARWGQPALTVAIAAFGPVLATVGYHELRRSREGVEASELAAVFE